MTIHPTPRSAVSNGASAPVEISVAIYETRDEVSESHRFVGYFYWPSGEVANVVFRGSDAGALRSRIATFASAQLARNDETGAAITARRAEASRKRAETRAAKKALASSERLATRDKSGDTQ